MSKDDPVAIRRRYQRRTELARLLDRAARIARFEAAALQLVGALADWLQLVDPPSTEAADAVELVISEVRELLDIHQHGHDAPP